MIPDWVKAESQAEFEEQMNIHCTTEAEKQKARDQRRLIKNRVSRSHIFDLHNFSFEITCEKHFIHLIESCKEVSRGLYRKPR